MKKKEKEINDEAVANLTEAIAPFAKLIMETEAKIQEMVETGIITQEQADDMTGASIDKMNREDLERLRFQVKCMAKWLKEASLIKRKQLICLGVLIDVKMIMKQLNILIIA